MRSCWAGLFAVALLSAGCSTPQVLRTARDGDLTTLKRHIAESQAKGELSESNVQRLARMVAGREVRSSRGSQALERLDQVRPCSRDLVPVLRDRARATDDAGALATQILIEQGYALPASEVNRLANEGSGAWRAVAARAAVDPAWSELRTKFLVDPDERVRQGALEASWLTPTQSSLEAVMESARLDPEPSNRRLASQVVGASGAGSVAVLGLVDHWARAEEPERSAILQAWAHPQSFGAGGERELLRVADAGSGLLSVEAAELLARGSGESARQGRARLVRALEDGTTEERRFALRSRWTLGDGFPAALKKLRTVSDRQVQVLALARSLDGGDRTVLTDLRKLAQGEDDVALQARAALAAAGDDTIAPVLERQLAAHRSRQRRLAAIGLIHLGRWSKAATALGDDDPRVRTQVACTVLRAAREGAVALTSAPSAH